MFGANKVEWTLDETKNQLSARFTLNNAGGWGAVGFKTPSDGSEMTGATIVLGYGTSGNGTINEYYASGNFQPSKLSANQFTSATSLTTGSTTTITLVRALSRPQNAPSTYYAFSKGTKTTLLLAAQSSQQPLSPTNFVVHDFHAIYPSGIDFYSNGSTCGTPKKSNEGGQRSGGVVSVMMTSVMIGLIVSFLF
ncbi:hypothetical protein FDP41_006542 [Naegleria fowleri]|uniref:DOMON domain-containing protein n=1 Tax=Naegleria fowleri TaxID=5763 RepID=A0A6A5BKH4_NAEFO|nr:uncharacterized protein FDP41_006542 [Naegleria fowleri]KAF0974510.1 hypothetical protein FDP41_006542 [Naegleria fowleri]CAG4707934.1 unnamed protein product [Naegleria fowleri]